MAINKPNSIPQTASAIINTNIGIKGIGHYVPVKTITNKDLEKKLDTTDKWIYDKVGIKERRIAEVNESASDLALFASLKALDCAGITAKDLDLIILNTSSPDFIQPPTSCVLQGKLGAYNATCFDIGAVCAGFIFGLAMGYNIMRGNTKYKNVLVVGTEVYSKILDWNDRSTCVFFGDGAGAVVLSETKEWGIFDSCLKNELINDTGLFFMVSF